MDYAQQLKDVIEYYVDLLIVQYKEKPKAKRTIELMAKTMLTNVLEQQIKHGFDVDTAEGVQLDIIGRWVGVDRFFKGQKYYNQKWFSFLRYDSDTPTLFQGGFSTYENFGTEDGGFLTYSWIIATSNKLNDSDFRLLVKLKITKNNSQHSPKEIDDKINALFSGAVKTLWGEVMELTYDYPIEKQSLFEVADKKGCIPVPVGVKLNLVRSNR